MASEQAHGCRFFNWPIGTEWVFVCDPFNRCDWPVAVDRIEELVDRLSIQATVTETCNACDGKSRHCVWVLLSLSKKPVQVTWKVSTTNCSR
jgi:hypothetical protein